MIELIKHRYKYLWVSVVFFLFSIIMLFTNLNLWIDMTGWSQTDYSYTKEINIPEISTKIKDLSLEYNKTHNNVINEAQAYWISWENMLSVLVWFHSNVGDTELAKYKNEFKELVTNALTWYDEWVKLSKYTDIWKSFWDYIQKTAYITLALALIWISFYIAYAFSGHISWIWSSHFWIATLLSLLHDVIICSWLYILIWKFFPEYKIDTYFITGLLTILGYSINDTVVWFDRIRDNLKIYGGKTKKLAEIIDLSINETVKRSIFTSFTFLFVLIAIFFFGPESLKWFMLLMILGWTVWTYSSIFIAAPLLFEMNKNTVLSVYKKKVISDNDKIVV